MNAVSQPLPETISLLYPDSPDSCFPVSSMTANDLDISFLAENVTENTTEKAAVSKILMQMPKEPHCIEYRRAVYTELQNDPALCKELFEICDSLRFSFTDRPIGIGGQSTIWELIQRFRSLEHYIRSVTKLRDLFEGCSFQSEGMKRLAAYIRSISQDSGYDELLKDIAVLDDDVYSIHSITLGVNLNADYYPAEVGIVSLNRWFYDEQTALQNFMAFHRKDHVSDTDLHPFSMEKHSDGWDWFEKHCYGIQTPHRANDTVLMNNLTSIIERMLPSLTAKLKKVLDKYVQISGRTLAGLADELLFYLRFIRFEQKLRENGFPCCSGEASSDDTALRDFYNIKLAVLSMQGKLGETVVRNDITFTTEQTVQILTGPNRGGKTILTQGIGLAFLLYQSGVFVPAASAKIRCCDGIYTHFPVEEERTVSLGRLGEEAERCRKICQTATADSLLLFNESFATTSHTESLYIAEDVLKYLCCLGARTCFNTHMHELGEHCENLSASESAVCGAVSIVMENGADNKYKISRRKPDGKSYAHVIAQQYGITFEQLSGMHGMCAE